MTGKFTDEEIQSMLDLHHPIESTGDVDLYKAVYKELKKPPAVDVETLAIDVVTRIQYKNEWKEHCISFFIVLAGIILGSSVFILAALDMNSSLLDENLNLILHHKMVFVYIIIVSLGITIADKYITVHKLSIN